MSDTPFDGFKAGVMAGWNAAIEAAAKVAETPEAWKKFDGDFEGNCIAAAIRALKQ